MDKEKIAKGLYRIIWLPDYSSRAYVKRNIKYLKSDLQITDNIGINNDIEKNNQITNGTYIPSLFKELVKISMYWLLDKNRKEEYDSSLKADDTLKLIELITSIEKILSKYGDETKDKFYTYIESQFISINSAYYSEIYKEVMLKNSYINEIEKEKGIAKARKLIKYLIQFWIPNNWGYVILALTFVLFIFGIIFYLAT